MAPLADIYWKSMTATHILSYNKTFVAKEIVERARKTLRYNSMNRALVFYEAQVKLMRRLDVPLIDMFNTKFDAGEWHILNDASHFKIEFNDYLMD